MLTRLVRLVRLTYPCALIITLIAVGCGGGTDTGMDDGGDPLDGDLSDGGSGDAAMDDGGGLDGGSGIDAGDGTDGGGGIDASDSSDGGMESGVADGGATDGCVPATETCDGTDEDCDGMTDEGFMLGTSCDGADSDLCEEGVFVCDPAGSGTAVCDDATSDDLETCNGIDDNCDGTIDEGNPGGGASCGASLGGCTTVTACVGGTLACRGTFVSPLGAPGNPGTQAMPLDSIGAAIGNATAIGGGADVCVCDPRSAGPTTYAENVTMVEGTSVLGGYDCSTWTKTAGRRTIVQNTDVDGLSFPSGITGVTELEDMEVDGLNRSGASARSVGITITDASPLLTRVTVRGGTAARARGVEVLGVAATPSPTFDAGSYTATASVGGTAIGMLVSDASPTIMGSFIDTSLGAVGMPDEAYGIHCTDCAGTTIRGATVRGGSAATIATGFYGTGNLAGAAFTSTTFLGGATPNVATGRMRAVHFDGCMGTPTLTGSSTFGGLTVGALTQRWGLHATGTSCAPIIDGGSHFGCEFSGTCTGIECDQGACVIRNATTVQGSGGPARNAIGIRCSRGACASITNSRIIAGMLDGSGSTGIGIELASSSPTIDDNIITGPSGGFGAVVPAGRYHGALLTGSAARLTNNVIEAGGYAGRVETVRITLVPGLAGVPEAIIHSNTIEYAACTGCGVRTGLAISSSPGGVPTPGGVIRNNVIRHIAAGGTTIPVEELDPFADFRLFENNDLYDPTAPGPYRDEGSTVLTIAGVNGLGGATGNFSASCSWDATSHIAAGSMCVDSGTAAGAPSVDYDGDARPLLTGFDVGADEYRP